MNTSKIDKKSAVSAVNTLMNQQDKLVLKFEPGTSVQHITEWVDYFLKQAPRRTGQAPITADSMHVSADGTVIVSGKNIGAVQGQDKKSGGKSTQKTGAMASPGDVMNGVDSFQAPRPPRPKIPDPNELNQIMAKMVGQPVLLKTIKTGGR
ncbi:hypothetical protein GCM10027341_38920 [Spirosoma knui]